MFFKSITGILNERQMSSKEMWDISKNNATNHGC